MSIPFLAMNTCTADAAETEGQKKEGYMFDDWTRLYRIGERGSSNGRSISQVLTDLRPALSLKGTDDHAPRSLSGCYRLTISFWTLPALNANDCPDWLEGTCARPIAGYDIV